MYTADNSDLSVSLWSWCQNLNQSKWVPLSLVITNIGSYTFKILQSYFKSSSFFLICSCLSIIRSIPISSCSAACYFSIFHFLEWSQLVLDFAHWNVAARYCVTIFIFPLFCFFETNLVVFQYYLCPWFFKSLISPKHFPINSCYFMNSFSSFKLKVGTISNEGQRAVATSNEQ